MIGPSRRWLPAGVGRIVVGTGSLLTVGRGPAERRDPDGGIRER